MKLPFDVHPALDVLGDSGVVSPLALAVSPLGDRYAYAIEGEVVVVAADGGVLSRFARANVRGLAFSPDGARLGILDVRFVPPRSHAATLEITESDGAVVARGELAEWGEASHGTYGGRAPSLVFHPDGRRVYARVALMGEPNRNAVAALEVSGACHIHALPASASLVFSLCFSRGRLFVQTSQPGDDSGLVWLDPDTGALLGRRAWAAGEVVVDGARGVWSVGHRAWVWRNDVDDTTILGADAVAAAWDQSEKLAIARVQALITRSGGKSSLSVHNGRMNYSAGGGQFRVEPRPATDVPGGRSYRSPGPAPAAAAIAAGTDDVLVCDGLSLDLLREQDGGLRVVHLLDDPRACTPSDGRLLHLAGGGDLVVVGWKKNRNASGVTLTALRLDLTRLDAAPKVKKAKK